MQVVRALTVTKREKIGRMPVLHHFPRGIGLRAIIDIAPRSENTKDCGDLWKISDIKHLDQLVPQNSRPTPTPFALRQTFAEL